MNSALEVKRWQEHLGELRKRLIISLIALLTAFAASLTFVTRIYHTLTLPIGGIRLAILGPGDVIHIYFMIAGFSALGVTLPFLLFQLWLFLKPALESHERKIALQLIPLVFIMFVIGVLFSYRIVFPILLHFLMTLASQNFVVMITAQNYFSFMVNILLPFGLIFEMPVVVMFLTQLGILTPARLHGLRKYAYMMIIVVASIISPPEIVSHLSVAVPMIILYEVSIAVSQITLKGNERRRRNREATLHTEQTLKKGNGKRSAH